MRYLYLITSILVSLVSIITSSPAQTSIDSKGTDFWLTFMPNFHQKDRFGADYNNDSLYIFIAASTPTSGTISYHSKQGNSFTNTFTISDTNQIYKFSIAYQNFELEGFNISGILRNSTQVKPISQQAFHVVSESEVTVYALSQAIKTSDAFLTIPTDALGTEYLVMAYRSDGTATSTTQIDGSSTPSQCAIIATDSNTIVHITPTTSTFIGGLAPRDIILQKGEVYLLQDSISPKKLNGDLTGTSITSDKPVAVFGGQQRARLPIGFPTLNSRDFLCEEMQPVPTWGRNYFITPYPQATNTRNRGTDLYRIMASEDNTLVFLNGNPLVMLNKGQLYENVLNQSEYISSSAPILIAQFKKTSVESQGTNVTSDPFMMIIPPREQYLKQYRCTNVQVRDIGSDTTYTEQYMTVIVPKYALDSVKLDGVKINPIEKKDIPFVYTDQLCVPYVYAWLKVGDGVHSIEANVPFGLLVYGYGYANSYGYVGGMALNNDKRSTAVTLGNDTLICLGSQVQLHATGGNNAYQWSPVEGLSCSDCANPIAIISKNTSFIARSINDGGCEIADTINITVNTPHIDAGKDTSICVGNSTVLIPSGGVAYIWSPSDGLSCVACNQPTASPAITTTYYVIGTDSLGCIGFDSVTVKVGLAMLDAGVDTSVCAGGSVQLHASDGIAYSWTPPIGLSCTDCQSPVATPNQSTMYYVTITNSPTCSGIDSVFVRIGPPIVDAGNDTTICRSGAVQLQASRGISYRWTPATGLSCTDCRSPIASPNQSTLYHVSVEASPNCRGIDSVMVRVQDMNPGIGNDTTICFGSSLQLHASGNATYLWSPVDGLSCTDCSSPIATPKQTTVYHLLATGNGCINQDSIVVTVNVPSASAWGDTTICYGDRTQIYSSAGSSYKWIPANGLSCTDCQTPFASPSMTTTYIVEVMNSTGCIARDSVKVGVMDCKPTIYNYGSLLLCDSAETTIWIRNRSDKPVYLQKIVPLSNFVQGTGFSLVTQQLPRLIKPFDSIDIISRFRPTEQRKYSMEYRVFTDKDSLQFIQLEGGGDFAKIDLTLDHDSICAPGNTKFPVKISAKCNYWDKAKVNHFTLDFRYKRQRILYDSLVNSFTKGNLLDASWSFTSHELIEPDDMRVLRIEAQGETPISADGVLADGSICVLLGDSAVFNPILVMDVPERSNCIQYTASVGSIELYSCFMVARFVQFGSDKYSLAAQGRTVDYSVGLAGEIRLELYNSLGELVRVLHDGQSPEGTFRLDIPDVPAGVYAVRMKAGQFADIKPLLIAR